MTATRLSQQFTFSTARTAARVLRRLPLPRGKQRIANFLGSVFAHQLHASSEQVPMAEGFGMQLALSDPLQQQMYFSGIYEAGATRLFQRLLLLGDTVIDGGANIGYFSLLAARLVGSSGSVHAFEPVPPTYDALASNIALNGFAQVKANAMALSDASGNLDLELPDAPDDAGYYSWAASAVKLGRGKLLAVPMCSLDDYASEHNVSAIRLAKLDLEGHELSALRGMTRLLQERRIAYLLCEVNLFLLQALGIHPDEIRRFLASHGYRCYSIDPRDGEIRPADGPITGAGDTVSDYLFVAEGVNVPAGRVGR